MNELINPFLNRNKVTSPDEFFGRKKEIDLILAQITYPEPQSLALIGERRSGKSSLLTYIYHLLSEQKITYPGSNKLVCIFLDPEEIATEHPNDMAWVIIDELVSENPSLLKYIKAYPPRDEEKAIPERHPRIILKNLIKDACKDNYKFVFLIDEFELLAKNKELSESGFLQYMRSISDSYALAFVTSSRKPLEEICEEHNIGGSPFNNNFSSPLYLGLLERNDCKELIQGTLKKFKYEPNYLNPFEEEAIELAGKHPYFLKIACAHLFNWISKDMVEKPHWKKDFKKEANEEFHRMWNALNEEQRDWLLVAQQSGYINVHEASIHASLKSLVNKGLLKQIDEDTKLKLFSEAFSSYIKEYVKALENDYEEIERQIREGYIKINIEDVKSTLEHLNRLKVEWKKRDKKSTMTDNSCVKCDHLTLIFQSLYDLIVLMDKSHIETIGANTKKTALIKRIDKQINNLAGYFEETEWFGESRGETIELHTAKKLLDALVEYLEEHEKQQIFGNGFDRILASRISFMKNYGYEKFDGFKKEVEDSFDRLTQVYDYSRASQVLQFKHSYIIQHISNSFFNSPLTTIFAIIILPFFFNNLIIEACRNSASAKTYNSYLQLLWVWVVALHIYLIWTMYKGTLSEKFCDLPESKKLIRKAVFPRTLLGTIVGFIFCTTTIAGFDGLRDNISNNQYLVLAFAALAGACSLFIVSLSIRQKVTSFEIAFRRAKYFCSVEYIRAFWLIIIISTLLSIASLKFNFTCLDKINILGGPVTKSNDAGANTVIGSNTEKQKFKDYILPKNLDIWGASLNFPLLLSLSFLAPLVGALKFSRAKK